MKKVPSFNENSQPTSTLLKEVGRAAPALLQSGGIAKKADATVEARQELKSKK